MTGAEPAKNVSQIRGFDRLRLLPGEEEAGNTPDTQERLLASLASFNEDMEVPEKALQEEVNRLQMIAGQQVKYQMFGIPAGKIPGQDLTAVSPETLTQIARRHVTEDELIRNIVRENGLRVEREELQAEAQRIADEQHLSSEMVGGVLGEDLEMLRDDILYRKAMEFVYDTARRNSCVS